MATSDSRVVRGRRHVCLALHLRSEFLDQTFCTQVSERTNGAFQGTGRVRQARPMPRTQEEMCQLLAGEYRCPCEPQQMDFAYDHFTKTVRRVTAGKVGHGRQGPPTGRGFGAGKTSSPSTNSGGERSIAPAFGMSIGGCSVVRRTESAWKDCANSRRPAKLPDSRLPPPARR